MNKSGPRVYHMTPKVLSFNNYKNDIGDVVNHFFNAVVMI